MTTNTSAGPIAYSVHCLHFRQHHVGIGTIVSNLIAKVYSLADAITKILVNFDIRRSVLLLALSSGQTQHDLCNETKIEFQQTDEVPTQS